jgi:hypothetical protein
MNTTKPTLQKQISEAGEYTPVPNWVFDQMLGGAVSDPTIKVFLYLYRKTVGWNNRSESQSLTSIMNATNIRGRHTAVYAVQMLCGCLGLWQKIPGIRGSQNSVFKPTGVLNPETFRNRACLTTWIYDNLCPTINDLRDLPPTEELYTAVASIVDSERDYKEKKRLIAQIVEAEKNQGQQTRAENAKHKREVMASRRNAREADQYAVS